MSSTLKNPPPASSTVRAFRALFSRPLVGAVTAALAAKHGPRLVSVPLPWDRGEWVKLAVCALVGYGAGYGCMGAVQWARWELVKTLLAYRGWMFKPNALSTKLWGLLLKVLTSPDPHGTFDFQPRLPRMPVPHLRETCDSYLKTVEPFLTEEEYEHTKALVEDFIVNEGPKLQVYLRERKGRLRNWMADWWMENAYLLKRDPIAINVNFFMTSTFNPDVATNSLARTANCIYELNNYYQMIRKNTLLPDRVLNLIPLCMDGCRYMFATYRFPGEHVDHIELTKDSRHIVVLSRCRYFRLDLYTEDEHGNLTPLTKREIKKQLEWIQDHSTAAPVENHVAALTTTDRREWAQNRKKLLQKPVNAEALRAIETAQFMICLGKHRPKNVSEQAHLALCGDGSTRWFDKCLVLEVFDLTTMGAANMEHSGADATHFVVMWEHVLQCEEYGPDGDLPVLPGERVRNLSAPHEIQWDLTGMYDIIERAFTNYQKTAASMDCIAFQGVIGRKWMKSHKISPDGFIQMAIQLTQWRLHKTYVKTYEPASHRLFDLGRTENINPVSRESINWVKTMEDPSTSREQKIAAMKKGIKYQSDVRLQCTAGYGCERHLLGLSMAAREMGMDMPRIFTDKAFTLPMKLSTSQVPTTIGNNKAPLLPQSLLGGFAPTAPDGYGILYCPISDKFNFCVTSWKTSPETDSSKFAEAFNHSMQQMADMMDGKDYISEAYGPSSNI